MANKMATMQGCCCETLPPEYECGTCQAGTTPTFFDVTMVRATIKRASTGVVFFEIPAGTYRCVQVSDCLWLYYIGSYSNMVEAAPCGTFPSETADIYVGAKIIVSSGVRVQYGVYRIQPFYGSGGFHNQWGPNPVSGDLGTGPDCGTIDVSEVEIDLDLTGGLHCIDGPYAYYAWEAGTMRAVAVP